MKTEIPAFTPTAFDTAEDKKKFAEHFMRFCRGGFTMSLFPLWFYRKLSNTFGHIAHYNNDGFYDTWFDSTYKRLEFMRYTLRSGGYGDPAFTYSDVEKFLKDWLKQSGLVAAYEEAYTQEMCAHEVGLLEKLMAKYPSKLPLYLTKKEDGIWLHMNAPDGKKAALQVTEVMATRSPVVASVINQLIRTN